MKLIDRVHAGRQLAKKLTAYQDTSAIVLALPRGGVPIGFEISQRLNLPLDVILVRKIGMPGQPEYGLGAVAESDVEILDQKSMMVFGITKKSLVDTILQERAELKRRQRKYRQGRFLPALKNKTVILVDDGVATGVTMRAAIKFLREKLKPREIVLALGVCGIDTAAELEQLIDKLVCLNIVPHLHAISQFYQEFEQTSDEEVVELLAKSSKLE
ncbi:phosphoribosyltransferase [Patescibacteria group bacterium]|nr:phosphoribosyltransferase [Patescibacteria group bacterium]MBU1966886.1 phosphoribosyltransferase [Patescibacteria group bacterium]MBU2543224.1 phosphoribosyltransferase [Patescibacteria group bacterium]